MKSEDALVEDIIKNGQVDLESWPSILNRFLRRLDQNVYDSFPNPASPVPGVSSEAPVGENVETGTGNTGMVHVRDQSLPPDILEALNGINETLTTTFSSAPPHTVQRLAELMEQPHQHYRSLPKYLRAIQRVISVSSTIDQYPPPSSAELPGTGLLNMLGSDESLGGALLTPISWLRSDSEMDYAPNGVTQGELLRQEQELGIVHENGDEIFHAHAQGPPTLGPEDLGPQPAGLVFPDLSSPPSEGTHARDSNGAEVQEKQEGVDVSMVGAEGSSSAENPNASSSFSSSSPSSSRQTGDVMDVDGRNSGDGNGEGDLASSSTTETLESAAGNDTAMNSTTGG